MERSDWVLGNSWSENCMGKTKMKTKCCFIRSIFYVHHYLEDLINDYTCKNSATPGFCATTIFFTIIAVWKLYSSSCHTNANPHSSCYRIAKHPQHIAPHFWPSLCSLGLLGLCKLYNKSTYFFALNNVERGQHVFKLCRNLRQLLFACSNYKAHTDIIAVLKTILLLKYAYWLHKNSVIAKLWLTWWLTQEVHTALWSKFSLTVTGLSFCSAWATSATSTDDGFSADTEAEDYFLLS